MDGQENPREHARSVLRGAVLGTPGSVDDVVDQLGAIEAAARATGPLGHDDGIACFTRLYRDVTCAVRDRIGRQGFESGDFVTDLDVMFARRYIDALRADLASDWDHPPAASCWRLLFDGRGRPDRPEWHHAALGVNAHVDFDLTFALLDVWERTPPERPDDHHADYRVINEIFAERMDALREEFGAPSGSERDDGSLADRLWNMAGDVTVNATRQWAWDRAVSLWSGRHGPDHHEQREVSTEDLDRWATGCGHLILRLRAPRWWP